MKIFKNKSFIRLFAFITACIIVITILATSSKAFASGSVNLVDFYSMPSAVFDYTSVDNFNNAEQVTASNQSVYDWFVNNDKLTCSENSTYLDLSTYPKYIFFGSTNNGKYYFAPMPDDSFILFDNDSFSLYYPSTYFVNGSQARPYFAYFYGSNFTNSGFVGWYNDDLATDRTITKDGVTYWQYTVTYQSYTYESMLVSNIKSYNASDSTSISGVDFGDNINNGASIEEGETAVNNMYFKDFNISYSVSGLYSGNVVCYGTLNDYQKEHLDEFALTYTFNFDYSFYVPSVGGWTETFTKNYSYQQTLSDFYSNSSSKTFTLKDIMQNINTQDISSEFGNLYQLINHYANQGTGLDSVEVNWTKAKMKTTVFIVSANDSPSDILNSSDLHSNSFSKAYNFLDGKSSTYSDGITSNNNPYQTSESGSIENENQLNNMPDGVSSSNIPSSQADNGGSGTSVVTGDNNIVINNNPNFTNNGGSGSGGGYSDTSDSGLMSTFYNTFNPFKTLFSSLNNGNEVLADDTAEDIGANRFLSLIADTFSFIPNSLLTAISGFFIASLTILIVAVVIRVLLDLL